jgi:hypothetical protein
MSLRVAASIEHVAPLVGLPGRAAERHRGLAGGAWRNLGRELRVPGVALAYLLTVAGFGEPARADDGDLDCEALKRAQHHGRRSIRLRGEGGR